MQPRKLGWVPEPDDIRDWSASERLGSAGPVPVRCDNSELVLSILDQGQYSSCVANAAVQAIRASHVRQGAKNPPLASRLFTYFISRRMHGAELRDEGTYVRSCFGAVAKVGFCPEEAWPYSEDVNQMPSFGALRSAVDQRHPTEYRKIYEGGSARVDMVKRALAAGQLVVFGTDIASPFINATDEVVLPPVGLPILGGHAMVAVSYDRDVFRVANSWSESWGDRGYFSMSADYMAWSQTRDLWIVTAAPVFSTGTDRP